VIEKLAAEAASQGADVIAFHECSVTGYTFARNLSKEQMLALAEYVPNVESVKQLTAIAKKHGIVILAGLFEKTRTGIYISHMSALIKVDAWQAIENCILLLIHILILELNTPFLNYLGGSVAI
jgi:predicted amidohydrolase